jgi:TRAP-type mannitol/chloroaromatic compound transport system substrate-binding protein
MPVQEGLERLSARITEASGGRLVWKAEPAGSICPATEEWKAVHTGVLDFAGGGGSYMNAEVHFGTLISQRVGGVPPLEHYMWLEWEGSDLINDWYQKLGYDMYDIKGGGFHGPPEMFGHFDKELKTPADLNGLKMRCSGDGGAILARMGVGSVFMPLGEIFESMKRGVIDAFECSSPRFDWQMGLNEVGKYIYLSPVRAPTEVYQLLVKRSKWETLPDDLKLIVEDCARSEALRYYGILTAGDNEALQNFKDYGNIVEKLPSDIEDAFLKEADAYYDEVAAQYPETKSVLDSQRAFTKTWEELYGLVGWAEPRS